MFSETPSPTPGKLTLPAPPVPILDHARIHETIEALYRRIGERFPASGLQRICGRMIEISARTEQRSREISRPIWMIRGAGWLVVGLLVLLVLVAPFVLASGFRDEELTFRTFLLLGDPILNEIVILGAMVFFLITLETRVKRHRALKAIHELRAIAHVIDMHQLTKDPDRVVGAGFQSTQESPKVQLTPFLLGRYLDYCTELLSLTGKLAAVYIQKFDDPVAIEAANDIESLTTGLSGKIWQKIVVLQELRNDPAAVKSAPVPTTSVPPP